MSTKGKSYGVSYSPSELKYKMFGKKVCPNCGGKLESFFSDWSETEGYVGGKMGGEREIYSKIQCYHCDSCKKDYTISELASK